jgi:hypothetical protein
MQPFFFALAIASLVYQIWLVQRRSPASRTRAMKVILIVSLLVNAALIGGWIVLSIRYA